MSCDMENKTPFNEGQKMKHIMCASLKRENGCLFISFKK